MCNYLVPALAAFSVAMLTGCQPVQHPVQDAGDAAPVADAGIRSPVDGADPCALVCGHLRDLDAREQPARGECTVGRPTPRSHESCEQLCARRAANGMVMPLACIMQARDCASADLCSR